MCSENYCAGVAVRVEPIFLAIEALLRYIPSLFSCILFFVRPRWFGRGRQFGNDGLPVVVRIQFNLHLGPNHVAYEAMF